MAKKPAKIAPNALKPDVLTEDDRKALCEPATEFEDPTDEPTPNAVPPLVQDNVNQTTGKYGKTGYTIYRSRNPEASRFQLSAGEHGPYRGFWDQGKEYVWWRVKNEDTSAVDGHHHIRMQRIVKVTS